MISSRRIHHLVVVVAISVARVPLLVHAQSAAPKPITLDDYAKIKRITGAALSTDGKWMQYTVTPNEGEGSLVVKALDGDKVYEVPRGTGASFSDNGRWVGYFVAPPTATGRGGRGAGGEGGRGGQTEGQGAAAGTEAPARTFELLELAAGTRTSFPSVGSFAFSPDGEWLLMRPQAAGAPPTDLTSFHGTLYRSTGNTKKGITEVGQVRMGAGVTPWFSRDLHESQSPVHNAPKIKTPFMILHGMADGSVDYGQGLEFYAAARRLGKQVILLSYPDETHHLGKKENQKDFQIRMRQFFDHYLKGAPAPLWMTDGVP